MGSSFLFFALAFPDGGLKQIQELCVLLRENIDADPEGYKIIVFFTTARLTQFYAELCNLMVCFVFCWLFYGERGGA